MDAGRIVALDPPASLIEALLKRGFRKPVVQQQANLDDVFLDVTGHALRED
jgi:ABC-2 type transport system ATP-binding protein